LPLPTPAVAAGGPAGAAVCVII